MIALLTPSRHIIGMLTLAYRPFLDPLPLDRYWLWLLPPLAIVVAIVYKAIKLPDLSNLPRQASVLAAQIVAFMILAAIALWLLNLVV
jgi:hypothetical protein